MTEPSAPATNRRELERPIITDLLDTNTNRQHESDITPPPSPGTLTVSRRVRAGLAGR